ncbi:MAG TPA: glycosyltransferase N-terminal domain-containing protein, partial [Candidatus Eisenbacteria bacterium]|nr:glycosyltransferase N-terminal domain-containing protein [Candidatus Eisenbacteria bacterium]
AGSVWIHAASLGEVGAARAWARALAARRYRPPFLLTTRTAAGLARARADLEGLVAARIAPHDLPQIVDAVLDDACPWRLDIIETEIWPNLIVESRQRGVAVALVGASVSERTTSRLTGLGVAGASLLGAGVYALPQSDTHARRFARLGVPEARIRVIGDLKAEPPPSQGSRPFGSRPALVFGSLRPGEERVARLVADTLERYRARAHVARASWPNDRRDDDPLAGRSRAVLIVAPRHAAGEALARASLAQAGYTVDVRDERTRSDRTLEAWIEELASRKGPRAGLLATRGELAAAYERAWGAIVGGTFSEHGGHNVWEAAARGCPVLVGPHHGDVAVAVDALRAEGGAIAAADERHAIAAVEGWLLDGDLAQRGLASIRAAARAAGAAERGLDAIDSWGLAP